MSSNSHSHNEFEIGIEEINNNNNNDKARKKEEISTIFFAVMPYESLQDAYPIWRNYVGLKVNAEEANEENKRMRIFHFLRAERFHFFMCFSSVVPIGTHVTLRFSEQTADFPIRGVAIKIIIKWLRSNRYRTMYTWPW